MSNKRKFTFLKSNYTLRTKHKTLNKKNTDIYVRDYMVTSNYGGWDSGSIPYGEGNFKMVHRFDKKQTRKHTYGKWVTNEEGDIWTLEEIKNGLSKYEDIVDNNKKLTMNTSYKSLLDFAYFGSCTELIKSSITDIITKFPGELYVTNKNYYYFNEEQGATICFVGDSTNGHDTTVPLYEIKNPFGIDIFTLSISPNNENQIKYFCASRNSYKILNEKEQTCDIELQRWIVEIEPNVDFKCLKNGQFIGKVQLLGYYNGTNIEYKIQYDEHGNIDTLNSSFIVYVYYYNGEFIYLTDTPWVNYHVRLSAEKIDEIYQTKLDDFECFLLNKETNPRFLIEIESLKETETSFEVGTMKLKWPTNGGWNLDIESHAYSNYVNKLLEQAKVYDEYYSNNLWRMMVHDSIKNMDLTFSNEKLDEDIYDYNIGTTRVEGLFWAYGREFDDLKRYIDNVKHINDITYNKNINSAANILYEKCELSGWELYDPTSYLKVDTEVKELYPNQFKSYNLTDVKDQFFTELLLNSKEIFSRKGTKYSIEMLLSLFGFCSYDYAKNLYPYLSPDDKITGKEYWDELDDNEKQTYYDYKINEYVAVATNTNEDIVDVNEDLPCETYNALKVNYIHRDEFNEDVDTLTGLPVREVIFINSKNEMKKYIIPWYSKETQYKDNKMYFQMYGGWGKISLKEIDETIHVNLTETKHFNELRSTPDFKIYSETLKYIKVKDYLTDLYKINYSELLENDIYYINYPIGDECHYYVLTDKEKSGSAGGWTPITSEDFDNKTKESLNVIYLESIIDNYKGNNPHIGYGKYDDGNEYLEYFRHLFKYEIDNTTTENPLFVDSAFDCDSGILPDIVDCGFTIGDLVLDNVKTWYFTPSDYSYMDKLEKNNDNGIYEVSDDSTEQIINVGSLACENNMMHFDSELSPFNLETQNYDSNDEAAANSIINVKNLKIMFANKYNNFEDFKKYLYGVIVPYITQLIPSTTILNIEFEGVEASAVIDYNFVDIAGIIK